MKNFKIGWLFIAAILFSACSGGIVNYDLDNQGDYMPINDSLRTLEKAGYINIDTSIHPNPLIRKVTVTFKPSFAQKYKIAKANHTLTVFYLFVAICLGLIVAAVITGINPGKFKGLPVLLCFLAVIAWLIAAASVDWAHEKEDNMPLIKYDSLKNTPGAIDAYWDQHLLK